MIARYKKIGLSLGGLGYVGQLVAVFTSDSHHLLSQEAGRYLFILSEVALLVGLAYYAKAKGRSPWFCLFALFVVIGPLVPIFLEDRTKTVEKKSVSGERAKAILEARRTLLINTHSAWRNAAIEGLGYPLDAGLPLEEFVAMYRIYPVNDFCKLFSPIIDGEFFITSSVVSSFTQGLNGMESRTNCVLTSHRFMFWNNTSRKYSTLQMAGISEFSSHGGQLLVRGISGDTVSVKGAFPAIKTLNRVRQWATGGHVPSSVSQQGDWVQGGQGTIPSKTTAAASEAQSRAVPGVYARRYAAKGTQIGSALFAITILNAVFFAAASTSGIA